MQPTQKPFAAKVDLEPDDYIRFGQIEDAIEAIKKPHMRVVITEWCGVGALAGSGYMALAYLLAPGQIGTLIWLSLAISLALILVGRWHRRRQGHYIAALVQEKHEIMHRYLIGLIEIREATMNAEDDQEHDAKP